MDTTEDQASDWFAMAALALAGALWGVSFLFGTLTLAPVALLWEGVPRLDLTLLGWASVLVLGLGCSAATYALWNWGVARVPASRAGVFLNLEPLVGALLGVLVLGEAWGPGTVVGGTLIIGAALLVSRRSSL